MLRISFFLLTLFCYANVAHAVTPLVGHKAVYDIKLLSSKNGSQIVGIGGQMTFSWQPSCDGWITDSSFKLRYDYADTDPSFIESHFTTHESKDHKELQFSSRRINNGKDDEKIRGSATTKKALYILPKPETHIFAPATIFPTKHTLNLIDAARTGKKFIVAHVFDGSDIEGVMDISTVIGKPQIGQLFVRPTQDKTELKSVDQTLLKGTSWPLRMAFFAVTEEQPNADYEMSLVLHENGIISDMIIDYSDFTIRQKLVSLKAIPNEGCGRTGKDG
jgi:hypothetical protein